jgi:hypothetical protein
VGKSFALLLLFFPALALGAPNWQTVGVFGWEGDRDAAIAEPQGFYVRDGKNLTLEFGVVKGASAYRWSNAEGYLPCLVTEFDRGSLHVKLESYADRVELPQGPVVVAYSRVNFVNTGPAPAQADPGAPAKLVPLVDDAPGTLQPGEERNFDFAIAIDRFGGRFAWPTDAVLRAQGGWDAHYQHMRDYWNDRLSGIAQLETPDQSLNDAYRAGFIYTHIVKDGTALNTGENGYDTVFDHDAIGIFVTLVDLGDLAEAKRLLPFLPAKTEYDDANWKYPWPWAIYLQKTDDLAMVKSAWSKIKQAVHHIESQRDQSGIMMKTIDVDTLGNWTVDNWSALTGLAAYRWLSLRVGDYLELEWAGLRYDDLLLSANLSLSDTISRNQLDYIPASITEPNSQNRTRAANDANWAAQFLFGRWAWDGYLLGATQFGAGLDLIDDTYSYGFERLKEAGYPEHTFGGYPGYSSAYNAGYGAAALRGSRYRSEGIRAYQFLIANAMNGPYSWWESIDDPKPSAWEGTHPSGGTGSCPHMWGQAVATKVLLESLAAEFYDGHLLVGRGIPDEWLAPGVTLSNFPIAHGGRIALELKSPSDGVIDLTFSGATPDQEIYVDLPIFLRRGVAASSAGQYSPDEGRLVLPRDTKSVRIQLGSR